MHIPSQLNSWLGGVDLSLEVGLLYDERQRQEAIPIRDQDGINRLVDNGGLWLNP